MNPKIKHLHFLILGIYLLGIPLCVGLYLLFTQVLSISLSPTILGVVVILIPLISACIRIYARRKILTDPSSKPQRGIRIFLWMIPVEILFFVVAAVTIFITE